MELQLKNIGMIKEANVKIDGLTVIAGENDTGKSTVGKALFLGLTMMTNVYVRDGKVIGNDILNILNCAKIFDVDILFGKNIDYLKNVEINIIIDGKSINPMFSFGNNPTSAKNIMEQIKDFNSIPDTLFIETPIVWSFVDTFRSVSQIGQQAGISINIPYLMNDLVIKLSNNSTQKSKIDISNRVKEIMQGDFKKNNRGIFFFEKDKTRVELVNTATGIKYFGMLQILSENGWLAKNNVIILDEPEVHLHPKWQLEMAKIIVELVKNGVKVLVNSHSPYMIEALQRYSELAEINSDFYLAEDGYIDKVNDSNAETLSKIFEKLSEPFDVFDEMDSQSMEKLING